MAGLLLNVLRKTHFDWVQFQFAASPTTKQPIGEPIDALHYTEVILIVRFHALDIDDTSPLTLGLYPDYIDDPGSTGFGNAPLISTTIGPLFWYPPPPALFIVGTPVISRYVTLGLTFEYSSGNASADISVDVCLRNPDDTRTATAIDLKTMVGHLETLPRGLRQRAPYLLGQLFEPWGLDLASVRFVVEPLGPEWSAKALSRKMIAVSPELVASNDPARVLAAIAHELSHIAQIRSLGWGPAAKRATREAETKGEMASRSIPQGLVGKGSWEINPADPRYTLEAISGRMGEIASGWANG